MLTSINMTAAESRELYERYLQEQGNISAMIRRATVRHQGSERLALRHRVSGEWQDYTYDQLATQIEQAARALLAMGLAEGGTLTAEMDFAPGSPPPLVGIFSANRAEWAIIDYACSYCRAVSVPLYPDASADELQYIVEHCGLEILFVDDWTRYRRVLTLIKQSDHLRHIVVLEPEVRLKKDGRMRGWEDFLSLGDDPSVETELAGRLQRAHIDDVASLVYTPGTEGPPQGVVMSHRTWLTAMFQLGQHHQPRAGEVRLSLLPQAQAFERACCYLAHSTGGQVDYCHDSDQIVAYLQESQPHYLNSFPRLWEKIHSTLLEGIALAKTSRRKLFQQALATGTRYRLTKLQGESPSPILQMRYSMAFQYVFIKIHATFGGRLKFCYCLGEPLAQVSEEFFANVDLALLPVYSFSECPVVSFSAPGRVIRGDCGQTAVLVELAVEPGDAAGGELMVGSPGLSVGYYREPERSAAQHTVAGFWHSGDRGTVDAQGYITVWGRMSSCFHHTDGTEISPEQIERRLKNDYYIEDILVWGEGQDQPQALIVPNYDGLNFYCSRLNFEFSSREEILNSDAAQAIYHRLIAAANLALEPQQQIAGFTLLAEPLSREAGELTALRQIRRKRVLEQRMPSGNI